MKKMLFTNNWVYQYVLLIILLLSGFVTVGYAASVPNVFTSGTVAKSSEVNENFNYLADRSWELNGNDIYYHKGNIGIGTTTPNANLHIKNLSDYASLEIESDNGRAVLRLNGTEATDGENVGGINFF